MFRDFFSANSVYSRAMNWLWNLLLINFLWIIGCIPVVTIGASTTAAYYCMAKCVRFHTDTVFTSYVSSFKANFRQSLPLTVIGGLILAILFFECVYLYSDSTVPLGMLYLFYLMLIIVVAVFTYLWPCLSRFVKGNLSLVKMSTVLTFRHLLSTILLLLLWGLLLVGIFLMPWGVLVFPAIILFAQTYIMEPILLKYSPPKPPDDDPESSKWYYQ